ncbi:MAG: tetratricopeptide repeat protein [Verrucomicrobiota bacterium]
MEKRRTFLVSLILIIATLALYWPATGYDFVVIDDNLYVTENPWVAQGLSWANVKWAFTTTYAANWHPITWLSHMLDFAMFGLFAGGHHLTNILLHTLNTLLLFLLLKRLTQSFWPSALVAALFGWHPLHVESVAWVAERKDVLSTLFLLLTIWVYARYAAAPTKFRYGLALVLFALGLMTKPMLVTLPCVLILLDYWPLKRWEPIAKIADRSLARTAHLKLLWEKVPLFALSFAACVVTFLAQRAGGAVKTFDAVPLSLRVFNSFTACARYVINTFFPANLCVNYPLPAQPPVVWGICSASILAGISYLIFRWRSKFPWMIVGWLWFLGTLVPVIGWVQVGQQAMADRYTYIPLIGLFILLVWSVDRWLGLGKSARILKIGVVLIALVSCLFLTRNQLAYWQESVSLFTHAVAVTKDNALAQQNLGVALSHIGKSTEAIEHYQEALRIKPNHVPTHYNLGIELFALEKFDEAELQFSEALRLGSRSEQLHNNLGVLLARKGQLDSAIEHFKQAIQLNPNYPKPYLNYAVALQRLGLASQAAANFTKALAFDPDWPEALDKFAFFLATCPETQWHNPLMAIKLAEHANEMTGSKLAAYLETLATAYAAGGKYANALSTAELAQKKIPAKNSLLLLNRLNRDIESYKAGKSSQKDWKNPL